MSDLKLKRLPLFSGRSINNSESFGEIEFVGNCAFATLIADDKKAFVFIRRFSNLEFEDGLIMTKETIENTFKGGISSLREDDFCLTFKHSDNLKSFIETLNKALEWQLKKELEVEND